MAGLKSTTQEERDRCKSLGCSSWSWNEACPLHGITASASDVVDQVGDVKVLLKGLAAHASAVAASNNSNTKNWEQLAVRIEIASLALATFDLPLARLIEIRDELRKQPETTPGGAK